MPTRRSFLALAALGLAGCSGAPPGGTVSTEPTDSTGSTDGTDDRPPGSSGEPTAPTGEAVQWRFETDGPVAEPRIDGDTLYVAGGANDVGDRPDRASDRIDQRSQNVLAVGTDGTERWRYEATTPVSALAPVEGSVYAVLGWSAGMTGYQKRVARVDPDGLAWESDPRGSFVSLVDAGPDGAVAGTHDDALGLGGERLFALDPDGTSRWDVESGDVLRGTRHDDRLYVGNGGGRVTVARDAATGETVWEAPFERTGDRFAVWDGSLYLSAAEERDGHYPLLSVAAADGDEEWAFVSDAATDGPFVPTNAVRDEEVVVGTEYGGLLFGVDPADGTERWHYDFEGDASDGLAVVDGVAYASDRGGAVHAVDAATGERRWRRSVPGTAWDLWVTDAAIVVDVGGKASDALVAFSHDGDELWRFSHSGSLSGAAVAGERAFVGTKSGYLAALGP